MNDRIYDKKQCGILNSISESKKEYIFKAGKKITLKKGDTIYQERDYVDDIYFILDGYVSLYKSSRFGEKKILFVCGQGEMINEIVIDAEKTALAASALDDTTLLVIPKSKFHEVLEQDDEITKAVFHSLARKTRRLTHQLGNANGTYPLERHLAAKIWKLARDYGIDTEQGKKIQFEVTVTFLACMVGAKRESVSRAISKLKKEGYILHDKGVLIVPSLEYIRRLV